MKILVDGISFNLKKTGGVNRYFLGFLPYLKKIEVELVLRSKTQLPKNIQDNTKISTIKEIPVSYPKKIFTPLISYINKLINKNFWQSKKGDIFHSTYYTRHPNEDMPQIITVYDLIYEKYPQFFQGKRNDLFKQAKKKAIESADSIICISQNTKKDLLKYYQIDKDKIHVVYPGVDEIFKPITNKVVKNKFLSKYQIKKPYLLYLGPRGRYKNFIKMIKAFGQWPERARFEIVIIGGEKYSKKEKLIISKLGLDQKLHNFGYVSDKDLVLFYNCAYALICPSLYEGFGIPLLEAMACGTLVLASNKSSFPEVGKDAILYFNPESKKDIIEALNKSLNKSLKKRYLRRGFKRVKDFSWAKTAKQTLAVYKGLHKL